MSVRLAGGFELSDHWRRVAGAVQAALRHARRAEWDVVLRPRGPATDPAVATDPTSPTGQDERDGGPAVLLDVADMHLDVGFPAGDLPIEGQDIGGLVVGLIDEAEDESADDYGPPDDDEDLDG